MELQRLNGGAEVVLTADQYSHATLPTDFDAWYMQMATQHPALESAQETVALHKKQVSLNKTLNLPSISAGYMSEQVVGEHFQGITLGVSIPLWENKNRTKQAKVAVRAAEHQQADAQQQLQAQFRKLYNRAAGLQHLAETYRHALAALNNTALLQKALEAGEISLLNYIVELGLYYDTVTRALEAERDFAKALAELYATELSIYGLME
jgi:outer membrane protein TolC